MYDNVAIAHEHSGEGRASREEAVLGAIGFVGLEMDPRVEGRRPWARATGAWSRSARAVVGKPRMVLLDEPAAGLPDEETEHMGRLIRKIPEHMGALVILVDHDMSLVSACCEITAVLDFGKLIASGPTEEVLRDEQGDAGLPRRGGGAE